jgi:hypothetical protein
MPECCGLVAQYRPEQLPLQPLMVFRIGCKSGENVVAQAALDAGVADALLLQPLTVESVRRTVNRLCGRRTQRTVKLHQI